MPSKSGKPKGKALLLGVGLDSDGHKRVTKGPNFALVGGSETTHEVMVEKAIKVNDEFRLLLAQLRNDRSLQRTVERYQEFFAINLDNG